MAEWAEMFSKDPDLGIMADAYNKLKSQNPNLHPPSKPTKRQITDVDRQKEEEELQMALALSIKDKSPVGEPAGKGPSPHASSSAGPSQQATQSQFSSQGTTAATVSRVRALYDFVPSEVGELQFRKGDIIAVLESVYKDWWKGSLRGQTGIFPLNYVEKLADPSQGDLQREAQMEAEVFGEIKNVEKLLTLLSASSPDLNVRDNEEITELYHSTLAIRPKLIELIGKYSQKKDDFTQLNEKFIKARRDYESLLDASMAQPTQQPYGRQTQQPYPHGGGGYPSQGPPPQQGPGRFYTPGPDSVGPRPAQVQDPPRNGPRPFVYGNSAPPAHQQASYPADDSRDRIPPSAPKPASDAHHSHRPQSTYDNPQELSTSSYTSPADSRQNSYSTHVRPSQLPIDYSNSRYPHGDNEHHQPPPQGPPQPSYAGPQPSHPPTSATSPQPPQRQQYPSYEQATALQAIPQAPSDNVNARTPYYEDFNGGPPTGGDYQAYHAPALPKQQPGPAAEAGSDPNDFYR
ncbi:MAG: hypothetical protein Q9163_002911 [Psora crenata]